MKKRYLEAAKLTKTVGLKGEMRAKILCDNCELLTEFDLYTKENADTKLKAESVNQISNDMCKIKIKGIDTIEKAQRLIGKTLFIDREDAELPPDTWFIADIIGLPVYDADTGSLYGEVKEILQNAPTDVYVIKTKTGKDLLFPAIPEVLLNIDLENEKIVIRPLKGLFDSEEEGGKDD